MSRVDGAGSTAVDHEHQLDLRGVRCPLNWARAKVRLESLARGERLTLLLDDIQAVRDIPRAAEAEGYAVDVPGEPADGVWRLRIQV
ncbi:MAG: sulfurtransferase TusA family protein [Candidatus Binatia bacterium]